MRLPITLFLPLFLLALPSTRSWDPPLFPEVIARDSVDAILARYSQAAGGEALKEISSETRRGSIVRGRSGRVPVEVVSLPQSRWRWIQTLAWGDRLAFGFDGGNRIPTG